MSTARPGQVKEITSLANPIVKDLRGLHLRKNRQRSGRFLVEGLKLITDALEKSWPIEAIGLAKSAYDEPRIQRLAAKVRAQGGDVLQLSHAALEKIARKDNPQMVVGVVGQAIGKLDDLTLGVGNTLVALDRVRDPGNLGTIIRTVDGFGASGVVLVGDCTDPFSLEAVRATMGSLFHVPLYKAEEQDFIIWSKRQQALISGTHLEGALDIRDANFDGTQIVIMGNEQQGLTPALTAECGQLIRIPMAGQADSFNLAVSTGIVLFEARKLALPKV